MRTGSTSEFVINLRYLLRKVVTKKKRPVETGLLLYALHELMDDESGAELGLEPGGLGGA